MDFLVEMAGIEPASKKPSSRESHVRLLSVRTNTSFDFYRNQQTVVAFKESQRLSLCGLYYGRSANVFTSFLLSVLAPQVSI
jgi:hypothetical protein